MEVHIMALTNSYLNTTKNLEKMFNSILTARAPERFTNKFLSDLGFTSSNDRLFIGVLKAIGLLDESAAPTQRYYDFLDQSQSKRMIAEGIREAYEDLFNLRVDAQNMTNEEVKNKLKTLTQGQKGDRVIDCMVMTFRALCDFADWNGQTINQVRDKISKANNTETVSSPQQINDTHEKLDKVLDTKEYTSNKRTTELHYNIQIHLPETRDMAVYDAIFQSLKKHIL